MALQTPVASKVATSTSSGAVTISNSNGACQYLVLTNTDATNGITVNINGATAVAKEGIWLAAKASVTVNVKEHGIVLKRFSHIADASTPVLAYQCL